MKKCLACGMEIDWVTTATGGKMIVQGPTLTIITTEGATVRGREVHWGRCTAPDLFRKEKTK